MAKKCEYEGCDRESAIRFVSPEPGADATYMCLLHIGHQMFVLGAVCASEIFPIMVAQPEEANRILSESADQVAAHLDQINIEPKGWQ